METSPPPIVVRMPENIESRRARIQRTRTGCQTCRSRKIKCDEKKLSCSQCYRGNRICTWLEEEPKRTRASRRANATACEGCRAKKLKCTDDFGNVCERCRAQGIECTRSRPLTGPASPDLLDNESQRARLGQLPEGKELEEIVQLFFSSVHHFGFFAFVHPFHFQRLLVSGKAPRELTLMMIASAYRFGAPIATETLARADAWADAAIGALLPRIYEGFGAVQLMTVLLAQHYDFHRGKFTSAWLLGASCTRMMQMMSLHIFDLAFPADFPSHQRLSPLLSRESLRRIAWSTFYLDSMTDGGRYGSQTIDERAYRIQLPCDQESFLGDDHVVTQPLIPDDIITAQKTGDSLPHASLDMSAYLLRTAAARRRGLHFAFRASYQETTVEQLTSDLLVIQKDLETVFADLPRRFQFNANSLLLHRDRLPTFIMLHVLRHNLFVILGRAALTIYLRDPTKADLINEVRRGRIYRALSISNLISAGLNEELIFDPHIGVQAYVALEILLFEPRRLGSLEDSNDFNTPTLTTGIVHCLTVIRDISIRSTTAKHLYLEAIHRLMNCGYVHLLDPTDLELIRSKHPLIGQDDAEFDFRDHRGAKLERLSKLSGKSNAISATHYEILLDDSPSRESPNSSSISPQPDNLGLRNRQQPPLEISLHASEISRMHDATPDVNIADHGLPLDEQQWTELVESGNTDHMFSSFNWLWSLDEWNG